MNKFVSLINRLQRLSGYLAGAASALAIAVILLQTFTRVVVFYSLPWSEELSRYLFVAVICLGLNVCIQENLPIKIDIFEKWFHGISRSALEWMQLLVTLFVLVMILISAAELMVSVGTQKSPAMQIPMQLMYALIFFSMVLAVFAVLVKISEKIKRDVSQRKRKNTEEV